jgi:hypothetical protein
MQANVGKPEIGQWYAHTDKGELFQVVGYDDHARTIEIQTFNGDLDEIDEESWNTLPVERTVQPEDWTGPVDDVETDDLGYSESEMKPLDWTQPLEPLKVEGETWEETEAREERDALGEGVPVEEFTADLPEAKARLR